MPSPCSDPNCYGVISAGKSECPDCKAEMPICCRNCHGVIPPGEITCPYCKTNRYSPELANIVRAVQEMCNSSCAN